ncbi:hypothetical protein ACWGI9_16570 [Streptomyces sp. NPDC054833]
MGWGDIRRDFGLAVPLCSAQIPSAALLAWIIGASGDDYGAGYGGAFGILCLLVFSPFLLPFVGVVQAVLLTAPSLVVARLAVRRFGGPGRLWHLAAPVAPAAVWGALMALLRDWPPVTTFMCLTALGVLPALGVAWARGRTWRPWGLWWRSALASVPLLVLTFGGGVLASVTGLIPQYVPPKLTTAQLTGVWRGPKGSELRLGPGGRAEAIRLATQPTGDDYRFKDYVTCGSFGTWETDRSGRDGVLVRLDGDCGEDTRWTIGGTEGDPELFVRFGDPDAGDLVILKRAAAG